MKPFIDECIDWRLSRDIVGHEVRTARQMGWSEVKNGRLLALVQASFDVFVTVDRNLSFQQDLPSFSVSVVVMRARSNRLAELRPLVPLLLEQIEKAPKGAVTYVGMRVIRGHEGQVLNRALPSTSSTA